MGASIRTNGSVRYTHASQNGGFLQIPNAGADYLGIPEGQLRDAVRAGRSLAELAQTQGKTIDGLKSALLSVFPESQRYDRLGADLDRMIAERHRCPRTSPSPLSA